MTPLARSATRVFGIATHVLLSVLIIFSTACLMRPDPEASAARHVATLLGFIFLVWVFVGSEMRATRILGFQEPDWVMVPRFAAMAAVVLLSGRASITPAVWGLCLGVVVFAVLRAFFFALLVMNVRVEDRGVALRTGERPEDPVVVLQVPPSFMAFLLALDPAVALYGDVLRLLYGEPSARAPDSP